MRNAGFVRTIFLIVILFVSAARLAALPIGFYPYAELSGTTDSERSLAQGVELYRVVLEAIRAGQSSLARDNAIEVDRVLGGVAASGSGDGTENAATLLANLYLAHMYIELIQDASSFFAYFPRFESALAGFVEAGGTGPPLEYLEAKKFLFMPPSVGGDIEKARDILRRLADEDDQYEIVYNYALVSVREGDPAGALAVLIERHDGTLSTAAQQLKRRLLVETANPIVSSIIVLGEPRVAGQLVEGAIAFDEGEVLTPDNAAATSTQLGELPGISSVQIDYNHDQSNNSVDITIRLEEGSQRILGVFLSSVLFSDLDVSDPIVGTVFYSDENLFGRGVEVSLTSAAVFWQLGFSIPVAGPIALNVGADALIVPALGGRTFYNSAGSPETRYSFEGSNIGSEIGVSVDIEPASLALDYRLEKAYNRAVNDNPDGFRLPNDTRHSVAASASVALSQDIYNGAGLDGYEIRAAGEYVYFLGFESWGIEGFSHDAPRNGLGSLTYRLEAGWGSRIGRSTDVGFRLSGYGGTNFYTRTLYEIGTATLTSPNGPSLAGQPSDSILARNVIVSHANLGYELVPSRLHVSLYHEGAYVDPPDWLYEKNAFLNSAGITVTARLPWSIDLRVGYAHSFSALNGRRSGTRDMVKIDLARLSAF
jgi:hypothetical protein